MRIKFVTLSDFGFTALSACVKEIEDYCDSNKNLDFSLESKISRTIVGRMVAASLAPLGYFPYKQGRVLNGKQQAHYFTTARVYKFTGPATEKIIPAKIVKIDCEKTEQRYNNYLQEEYYPAQEWYENGGQTWISKYINSANWIIQNYNKVNKGIYKITFNSVTAYVGRSLGKLANRLVVHAFHLMKDPEIWFGVFPEEIKSKEIQIDIRYIETGKFSDEEINKKEETYIKELKPYLQGESNVHYDRCIYPKGNRRDITKTMLNLKEHS